MSNQILHSIQFAPGVHSQAQVVAAIAAIYGLTAESAPLATAIQPGNEPEEAGGAPAAGQTVDAEGVIYDKRIHSDPAKLTEKGVWRARRNVDKALVAQVIAAQKGGAVAQTAVTAAPAVAGLPTLAAVPGLPTLAAPVVAQAPSAFEQFTTFVAENLRSTANPGGKFDEAWVQACIGAYGIKDAEGKSTVLMLQHAAPDRITDIHKAMVKAIQGA